MPDLGAQIADFEQRLAHFSLQSSQLADYYNVRGHLLDLRTRYGA